MSDHLPTQLFERYRQRGLGPEELLELDDHVATCATCRERLREARPARAALVSLKASLRPADQAAPDHLTGAQWVAYTQGQLNEVDRELAESHLELCPQCAAQAKELRNSVEQQASIDVVSPASNYTEPSPPAPWRKLIAALGLSSLWEGFLKVPFLPRVAGAVAVMALLAISLVLWLRTPTEIQEVVDNPPATSPSPSPQPVNPPPVLQPATPPPILFALSDGGSQITVDSEGNVTGLESLSPSDQQLVRTALMTQKILTPKTLRELGDSSAPIMGGRPGTAFALLDPIGRIVATDRPTFRWRPSGHNASYQVTITDPEADYKEIATSPEMQDTKWTVDRRLEPGRIYSWQVTARIDGADVKAPALGAPEAKFKVMEQAKAVKLAKAKKAYAGRHLVLGLLYADAGLVDEAEREFQALAATNPQSTVAKSLLHDIRGKKHTR